MVMVEGGNVLHHVKSEGGLSGSENVRGEYVQRKCPDPWTSMAVVCLARPVTDS